MWAFVSCLSLSLLSPRCRKRAGERHDIQNKEDFFYLTISDGNCSSEFQTSCWIQFILFPISNEQTCSRPVFQSPADKQSLRNRINRLRHEPIMFYSGQGRHTAWTTPNPRSAESCRQLWQTITHLI